MWQSYTRWNPKTQLYEDILVFLTISSYKTRTYINIYLLYINKRIQDTITKVKALTLSVTRTIKKREKVIKIMALDTLTSRWR
jgi:hypothetical protein